MSSLSNKKCVACETFVKPMVKFEVLKNLKKIKVWKQVKFKEIEKEFKFKDFQTTIDFVNKVAGLSEKEGHHPDILVHGWNKCKIMLSTHNIKGLSINDFILASKIDKIVK